MTWIKICGITNLEDAQTAVDAGADALGFVFYEKSPRNVAPDTVREIIRQLPAEIEKVGVLVGIHPGDFLSVIHETGLTACQVHFGVHGGSSESKTYGLALFPPGFKTYWSMPANWFIEHEDRARDFVASFAKVEANWNSRPAGENLAEFFRTIFLDSGTLQQPGGTGMVFDWQKASGIVEHMKKTMRVVVAGGLNPGNVGDAIRVLHPWGVDVSSGVEAKPGKKDPQKIQAFVAAARNAENN